MPIRRLHHARAQTIVGMQLPLAIAQIDAPQQVALPAQRRAQAFQVLLRCAVGGQPLNQHLENPAAWQCNA
ncbi:hypothetical protein D3C85_1880080 [compost metagenome]